MTPSSVSPLSIQSVIMFQSPELSPKTIRGPALSYWGAMKLVIMVLLPSPWVWAYLPSPPQS